MEHIRYPNLLARNFCADKPLRKIVTDVTCIHYRGRWFYLAAYLDLFNNEILERELSDTFDNFLVMRPAERLLKRAGSTSHQVLFHIDQGVQYAAAGFCNLLSQYMNYFNCVRPVRKLSRKPPVLFRAELAA